MTNKETPVLGRRVEMPTNPHSFFIDTVLAPLPPLPDPGSGVTFVRRASMMARFSCPEFTSLCPVTGQPDYAHIIIDYVPKALLIESKSLKLFLTSFRNHGAYHEACTCLIGDRLWQAAEPAWMRVNAYWFPRGGIPIDVFWECGERPERLVVPPIDIPSYRAR
jgi:7-cyano-7-deazaguanine reductase